MEVEENDEEEIDDEGNDEEEGGEGSIGSQIYNDYDSANDVDGRLEEKTDLKVKKNR